MTGLQMKKLRWHAMPTILAKTKCIFYHQVSYQEEIVHLPKGKSLNLCADLSEGL